MMLFLLLFYWLPFCCCCGCFVVLFLFVIRVIGLFVCLFVCLFLSQEHFDVPCIHLQVHFNPLPQMRTHNYTCDILMFFVCLCVFIFVSTLSHRRYSFPSKFVRFKCSTLRCTTSLCINYTEYRYGYLSNSVAYQVIKKLVYIILGALHK